MRHYEIKDRKLLMETASLMPPMPLSLGRYHDFIRYFFLTLRLGQAPRAFDYRMDVCAVQITNQ
jgi:hypothetical protein